MHRLRICRFGLRALVFVPACLLLLGLAGCATIENLVRLREVQFFLDRVSGARLAGVDLERIESSRDISTGDVLRIADAIRRGTVPFELVLHVGADNPGDNSVEVERVQLDWTLYLDQRETVSGVFDRALEIAPGGRNDLPIDIQLDLYRFFREDARDLLELARELAGGGDAATSRLSLRA
ncbi:MAG TPA: hypothetical protein VNB06_16620 [Thermoanaerobaculia bacterium]|nr:hypothetical protein [Thermoanaerobaculia bacterium]